LAGLTGRRSEAARRLHRFIEKHKNNHFLEIRRAISSVYEFRKVPEQVKVEKKQTDDSSLSSSSKSTSPQRKLPAGRGASQAQREQHLDSAANGRDGNSSSSRGWTKPADSVGSSVDASIPVSELAEPIREDGSVIVHPELNVAQPSNNGAAKVESDSVDSTVSHSPKGKKQRREE